MTDTPSNARRTLPSALSAEFGTKPTQSDFKAAQRLTAPLGVVSDRKVKEQSSNFTLRLRDTTRSRLKEFAYMQRLSLDEAISQLLDTAGET